jgi:hypothetical protein
MDCYELLHTCTSPRHYFWDQYIRDYRFCSAKCIAFRIATEQCNNANGISDHGNGNLAVSGYKHNSR